MSGCLVLPPCDPRADVGILYIFAISSLGVYGVIMGGWASNSKYPFLGALRSAAQMVSYEVSIGFVIITVLLCVGSLNLTHIVLAQQEMGLAHALGVPWLTFLNWFWLPLFPMFIIFFISALAETNRPPFDLVEAVNVPALIMHGTEDEQAPLETMQRMKARMRTLGKACAFTYYPGARHGFAVRTHPGYEVAAATRSFEEARRFLDAHVRAGG